MLCLIFYCSTAINSHFRFTVVVEMHAPVLIPRQCQVLYLSLTYDTTCLSIHRLQDLDSHKKALFILKLDCTSYPPPSLRLTRLCMVQLSSQFQDLLRWTQERAKNLCTPEPAKKRALLIGVCQGRVRRSDSEDISDGRTIKGPLKDVQDMRSLLIRKLCVMLLNHS